MEKEQQKIGEKKQMQIVQNKNQSGFIKWIMLLLTLVLLLESSGCTSLSPRHTTETTTEASEETSTISDNLAISGVVTALDTEVKNITVLNIDTRESTTFAYSTSTLAQNKYGDGISMAQLQIGEIVDLEYSRSNGRLKEVTISPDAWELNNITQFTMDRTNKTIQAGSYLYQYDSSIAIVSDGTLVEPIEISDQDELTIKGRGTTAYSIIITKGHGYVSLENEELFLGGILTIGKIAKTITTNMLVVVPEGDYTLEVIQGNVKGQKQIRVEKNEELAVDIRSFVAEARQIGTVNFKIEPENAKLYVNGKETNHKEVATFDYGTYAIRVEADGYVPFAEKYQVENSYQQKAITLEVKEGESSATEMEEISSTDQPGTEPGTVVVTLPPTDSSTGNTTQTTSIASTESTTSSISETTVGSPASVSSGDVSAYKIHIMEPSQTEVYFDGDYIGIAPVTLTKVSGEHTIILKKDGYVTKTYTVNITSDQIDSYYSFPALAAN